MTKLGIIREGKTPPDKRVPLTPEQCKQLAQKYPELDIVVQPSNIRAFSDQRYKDAGLQMNEDLSDRDILMGVKEVPEEMLIPEKTYMFFSHTYKKQPYNRSLLQTILDKKIQLIDYEVLTDAKGRRLIGFGRYAGVVGCYNGFLATGKKLGLYNLKPAHLCEDRKEVEAELKKVKLPDGFKVVLTGKGRVSGGAIEILRFIDIDEVSPEAYLTHQGYRPVFTVLGVEDYNVKSDGSDFSKKEFYEHPERFDSNFMRFAKVSDLYVSCHYWDSNAPYIFSREDARSEDFKIRVVADISCDIDGPVASTLRPSTIADPLYGYDP
ncbi:MAG TPA: NAD(P)-dependent oxidoreductase, partial [Cryomorphaceae bacterium]|nr:NAD(P)-dependent oxidoreductase [Cryomorphaceae bacterium]